MTIDNGDLDSRTVLNGKAKSVFGHFFPSKPADKGTGNTVHLVQIPETPLKRLMRAARGGLSPSSEGFLDASAANP